MFRTSNSNTVFSVFRTSISDTDRGSVFRTSISNTDRGSMFGISISNTDRGYVQDFNFQHIARRINPVWWFMLCTGNPVGSTERDLA